MPHLRTVILAQSILLWGFLVACSQQTTPSASQPAERTAPTDPPVKTATEMADMPEIAAYDGEEAQTHSMEEIDAEHLYEGGAHADHDSKHGGTFFMALDNQHHLEGALERPGVFRAYVYDAYTQPVSAEELGKIQAKVIWGDQDGAPEIELKPNAEGTALEASPISRYADPSVPLSWCISNLASGVIHVSFQPLLAHRHGTAPASSGVSQGPHCGAGCAPEICHGSKGRSIFVYGVDRRQYNAP